MTDIFPLQLTSKVRRLTYPEKDFKYLTNYDIVFPFIMQLKSHDKLYYHKRHFRDKYIDHLRFVCKESRQMNEFRPNDMNLSNIATRFRKPVMDNGRKNIDVRAGYKIENCFLVKAYFTFGQRTVEEGTAHVYQILNVPLLIYIMADKSKKYLSKEERIFPVHSLHLYDRYILEANKNYKISSGVTYLILSTQKNFFRVDKVLQNCVLPFHTEDPTVSRVRKINEMYDVPIKTPYIEAEEEEKEETWMETNESVPTTDPVSISPHPVLTGTPTTATLDHRAISFMNTEMSYFEGQPQLNWVQTLDNQGSFIYIPVSPSSSSPAATTAAAAATISEAHAEPGQLYRAEEANPQLSPVAEMETNYDNAMQQLTPSPSHAIPSSYIFEKEIVISCPDFIKTYNTMATKKYDAPPPIHYQKTVHLDDHPPLNLSKDKNFDDIDTLMVKRTSPDVLQKLVDELL